MCVCVCVCVCVSTVNGVVFSYDSCDQAMIAVAQDVLTRLLCFLCLITRWFCTTASVRGMLCWRELFRLVTPSRTTCPPHRMVSGSCMQRVTGVRMRVPSCHRSAQLSNRVHNTASSCATCCEVDYCIPLVCAWCGFKPTPLFSFHVHVNSDVHLTFHTDSGTPLVPLSWTEVHDPETGMVEPRKVARPVSVNPVP